MNKIIILVGCLFLLLPAAASAAEGGLYLSLQGGAVLVDGAKNDSDSGSFNFEFDPGWLAGVSLGYDLRERYPHLGQGRIELEFTWRESDVDDIEFRDPSLGPEGQATVTSLMLNTIGESRDFLPWLPYFGLGAGAARITLEDIGQGGIPLVDDEDTVFAWQVLAGVGWQVSHRLVLDVGYRYFSALDPEFTDELGVDFESEYDSHNITLGARFDF